MALAQEAQKLDESEAGAAKRQEMVNVRFGQLCGAGCDDEDLTTVPVRGPLVERVERSEIQHASAADS